MKLKELESILGQLEGFSSPRIDLEQYETQPHLAARTLFSVEQSFGDISGNTVADLGCGPGALSIGSSLLGADFVFAFDIDSAVTEVFQQNCDVAEVSNVECVLLDAASFSKPGYDGRFVEFFDTVILNPPFGTKNNQGIDVAFLLSGINLSRNAVYSFHKSATRKYLLSKEKEWHVKMQVVAELRFDLPQTYKRHKKESVDIQVDFIRTTHV